MSKKNPTPDQQKQPRPKAFYRFTGMAIKMAVIITGGTLGGVELDKRTDLEFPVFTLVLSLLSVSVAMYLVIRDLTR